MRPAAPLHSGTDKPFRNVALGVGDMPTPTQLLPANLPLASYDLATSVSGLNIGPLQPM